MAYTSDVQVDLVTPPGTPTGTGDEMGTVKVEQVENDPTPVRATATKTKSATGTKTKRRLKLKKRVVKEQDTSPNPERPQKRKRTQLAQPVLVTDVNQEELDVSGYYGEWDDDWNEDGEWYGGDEWQGGEEQQQAEATPTDNYPWNLWNLIYLDIKLGEHPQVIHDVCVALQAKQITHPWQLTYLSREFLEKIFPMDTHPRHLCGILRVQDVMKSRGAAEASGNVQLTRAVLKMTKNLKDQEGYDTSSDEESKNYAFNYSQSMKQYNLEELPQGHSMPMQKVEPLVKRAAAGQKKRGKYVVPGGVMDYTPNWMKEQLPKELTDCKTHAHWVAGYWSRALAQIATQGHTGQQTLSVQQLLAHFLNINQACLENANKVGWFADQEMWLTAVEATRRRDPLFDLKKHFQQVTRDNVAEGVKAMNGAYATAKPTTKKPGKGSGGKFQSSTSSYTRPQVPATYTRQQSQWGKGKAWYKGGKTPGKWAHTMEWDSTPFKGKGFGRPKGGKGLGRPKGGKRQAAGETAQQK